MRTLIDRMLGRKREQSASAIDKRAEQEIRQARAEFLRSARQYTRTVSKTIEELLSLIDEQQSDKGKSDGQNGFAP